MKKPHILLIIALSLLISSRLNISDLHFKIPNDTVKLAVYEHINIDPFVRKKETDSDLEFCDSDQNHVLVDTDHAYTRLLCDIDDYVYACDSLQVFAETGYNAIITVNPGEEYKISGSGIGVYPAYIYYDKYMGTVAYGGTGAISDFATTVPADAKFLRVQNNRGANIIIKKKLSNRRENIVWVGDSYTQANSLGADKSQRFATLVSARLDLNEFNYAVGGNGLFKTDEYPNNFCEQLKACAGAMTPDQRTRTKYIIVCGGRNDPYLFEEATQSDFDAAVNEFFGFVDAWYPDANVIVIPYLWDASYMSCRYYRHYEMYLQALRKHECRIVSTAYTWLTGYFNYILPDNCHPNVDGHARLSEMIYNAVIGSTDINDQFTVVPATSEYMPAYAYVEMKLVKSDMLLIESFITTASNVPANTVIFELNIGAEKKYTPYLGRDSMSLFATNLTTGKNYPIIIRYNDDDIENYKLQIMAVSSIPAGNYVINFSRPYGVL